MLAVLSMPRPIPRIEPASADVSDASLVERAIDGDRWAMEALYRRHVHRVTNAVTRVIGRSADADDVVQDTFVIALNRLGELREPAAFRGWLARIAMNEVRMRLRKRKWMRRLALDRGEDDVSLESIAAPDASPEVKVELARLDRVLAALDPELRFAFVLRYVEDWALDEVASALDCSLATAKRRIKGARDRIDAHLAGGKAGGAR
jgi:RNA polymerase sigma-70 factor (ECF subfamily)